MLQAIPGATPSEPPAEQGGEALTEAVSDQVLDTMVYGWLPEALKPALEILAEYPLLLVALLLAAGYLFGKLLQYLISQAVGRLASRTETDYDDRLIGVARRPAMTIPVLLALLLITALLPLEQGGHNLTVRVLFTLLLLSLIRAALGATHVLLEMLGNAKGKVEIIQARTIPLFEITVKLLLVAIAGYVLLMIWGINPTAWLASAGVIGIAVGFAARDTLANLFSGIFIVADAPYKIGDYIVLDTGERGEVTALGMRSTRLLTRDDIEITIPNAIIANAKIINESGGPWEKHRVRIPVGVAYGSDVDEVVALLLEVAKAHPRIIKHPEPRVRMRGFGASSLDFELLGWIEKPVYRGSVLHEMMMSVYKRFNEAGVQIPFPQTDVWLRNAAPDSKPD